MVFKCQEDSFLKEFQSIVLSCEKVKESISDYGKVSQFDGYKVILENTILFPAGGGQPHDTGYLNSAEVLQVLRKGPEALHFTKEPLEVGAVVSQTVNWERRFDHMQQHSGQHLLSAILEREHSLPTTSWWLGAEESYVELNSLTVPDTLVRQVEERCNDLIRQALPVTVKFCKIDDPDLDEAHTRGLPKDCTETIRIIRIENIDENMCCGTHVSNLSQLQTIKLLGAEPGKKGKTNLRFLVGNRVTKTLQQMLDREKALTGLLNECFFFYKESATFISMAGIQFFKYWRVEYPSVVAAAAVHSALMLLKKEELLDKLRSCPVYCAAQAKALDFCHTCASQRLAIRTIANPRYNYRYLLTRYGLPPLCTAQKITEEANKTLN